VISQSYFTALRRDGDHVIKMLGVQNPPIARFAPLGQTGMNNYLSTLRVAGIRLPPDLTVVSAEPLAVRHRWVRGPVLLDYAAEDRQRFVAAVAEIAGWVNATAATDARLDANLANFCLADGQVVLVDVLPPLIPSARLEPSNLFEVLFTALCFDTAVIRNALIGYAARALLRYPVGTVDQAADLAGRVPLSAGEPAEPSFPALWFRAKAVLALRALAGEVSPEVAYDFLALTSVRVFRELPEVRRAHRLYRVEQVIKELALA
jgi:hypothetical protein